MPNLSNFKESVIIPLSMFKKCNYSENAKDEMKGGSIASKIRKIQKNISKKSIDMNKAFNNYCKRSNNMKGGNLASKILGIGKDVKKKYPSLKTQEKLLNKRLLGIPKTPVLTSFIDSERDTGPLIDPAPKLSIGDIVAYMLPSEKENVRNILNVLQKRGVTWDIQGRLKFEEKWASPKTNVIKIMQYISNSIGFEEPPFYAIDILRMLYSINVPEEWVSVSYWPIVKEEPLKEEQDLSKKRVRFKMKKKTPLKKNIPYNTARKEYAKKKKARKEHIKKKLFESDSDQSLSDEEDLAFAMYDRNLRDRNKLFRDGRHRYPEKDYVLGTPLTPMPMWPPQQTSFHTEMLKRRPYYDGAPAWSRYQQKPLSTSEEISDDEDYPSEESEKIGASAKPKQNVSSDEEKKENIAIAPLTPNQQQINQTMKMLDFTRDLSPSDIDANTATLINERLNKFYTDARQHIENINGLLIDSLRAKEANDKSEYKKIQTAIDYQNKNVDNLNKERNDILRIFDDTENTLQEKIVYINNQVKDIKQEYAAMQSADNVNDTENDAILSGLLQKKSALDDKMVLFRQKRLMLTDYEFQNETTSVLRDILIEQGAINNLLGKAQFRNFSSLSAPQKNALLLKLGKKNKLMEKINLDVRFVINPTPYSHKKMKKTRSQTRKMEMKQYKPYSET